jgi:hypothetical protein
MCCLFAALLVLGPRVAGILWWIASPAVWSAAFNGSWLWPVLGLIALPWVTLMYVLVAPGGIEGFDWLWLGLALAGDVAGYAGGAKNRNAVPGMPGSTSAAPPQ